jgi:hypothetical protein
MIKTIKCLFLVLSFGGVTQVKAQSDSVNSVVDRRMAKENRLITYKIETYNYHGLKVFALDGGMSAEYAVEKAGESIGGGMSHSWKVNGRGSGPNQVFFTPEFLDRSVKATVSFYDRNFGFHTAYNTVVISTGIPSVPYLARAMKAPVLPLHFLVSANSVKELKEILSYSGRKGYSCYSTLGYDSSVPGEAVAWVKLLDIPRIYIDFLKRHHVKQVILLGATSPVGGEATAKKVISGVGSEQKYAPGSLFILYPQGGVSADEDELKARLIDLSQTELQHDFTRVADWESGIIPGQVQNFNSKIKELTTIKKIIFITGRDDDDLYKLATYVSLAFIHKNANSFSFKGKPIINGIILNPYLISNPVFESRFGYIPYVYWQGNSSDSIIKEMESTVKTALTAYFPGNDLDKLNIWINSSLNFGGYERALALENSLKKRGFKNVKTNNYTADEVWNTADGFNAPCELKTKLLLKTTSAEALKIWNNGLKPLSVSDLKLLSEKFPAVLIKNLNK